VQACQCPGRLGKLLRRAAAKKTGFGPINASFADGLVPWSRILDMRVPVREYSRGEF